MLLLSCRRVVELSSLLLSCRRVVVELSSCCC